MTQPRPRSPAAHPLAGPPQHRRSAVPPAAAAARTIDGSDTGSGWKCPVVAPVGKKHPRRSLCRAYIDGRRRCWPPRLRFLPMNEFHVPVPGATQNDTPASTRSRAWDSNPEMWIVRQSKQFDNLKRSESLPASRRRRFIVPDDRHRALRDPRNQGSVTAQLVAPEHHLMAIGDQRLGRSGSDARGTRCLAPVRQLPPRRRLSRAQRARRHRYGCDDDEPSMRSPGPNPPRTPRLRPWGPDIPAAWCRVPIGQAHPQGTRRDPDTAHPEANDPCDRSSSCSPQDPYRGPRKQRSSHRMSAGVSAEAPAQTSSWPA